MGAVDVDLVLAVMDRLQALQHLVVFLSDAAGIFLDDLARLSQGNAAIAALQKGQTDIFFEFLDHLAQGRLGHVGLGGTFGDAALLGDQEKIFHDLQIHGVLSTLP